MAQTTVALILLAALLMLQGANAKRRISPSNKSVYHRHHHNLTKRGKQKPRSHHQAKPRILVPGGCSAFGHSCFGGHGKRSGDTNNVDSTNPELMMQRQLGQEETPPHPGYPRSGLSGLLPAGDDIIPVRDGGIYDPENTAAAREVMKFKLRNIVKHWMDNYRRSQQSNDDGYYAETL